MKNKIVSMPVTVEQIAAVIRRMGPDDRQRLLELVPELGESVSRRPSRTVSQAKTSAEALRQEIATSLEERPLSPDEPFLGGLTLGDYLALSDEERDHLWCKWAGEESWEEVDVLSDAVST